MTNLTRYYLIKKITRAIELIDAHNYLISKNELQTILHDLQQNDTNNLDKYLEQYIIQMESYDKSKTLPIRIFKHNAVIKGYIELQENEKYLFIKIEKER